MVQLVQGGLSGGNLNKRALEDGNSSFGDNQKFKPRRISAVRDFPRGCGRDAEQIIPEPLQNVTIPVGEQGEARSFEIMESQVRVDTNGDMVVPHVNSDGEAIEDTGGIVVVPQLCAARETNEFRMPANLEQQEILDAPVREDIVVVEKADGTETPMESEIQSDEFLGNPVGMQADIALDDLVGKVVATVMDGIDDQVEENVLDVKPMDIELPEDFDRKSFEISKELNGQEAQSLVKQLDNMDSSALVNHVLEENVKASSETGPTVDREVLLKDEAFHSPRGKFHRRRVSATRDFPPCCGRNVPPLVEEEQVRNASREKSLTGVEKGGEAVVAGGGATEENIEDDGGSEGSDGTMSLPNRVSSAVEVKSHEEEGEFSAMKDIVSHEPFGAVKGRPSSDVFTSVHNEEPVIVNALMSAPHCPWRQGKVALSLDAVETGVSAHKDTADRPKKSTVVAKKSTIKADSSGRQSLKKDSVSEDAHGTLGLSEVKDEEEYGERMQSQNLTSGHIPDIKVTLLPYSPDSSSSDARNKVREKLNLFQTICKKILEEAKTRPDGKRIDLEAVKIMKNKGIDVAGKKHLGAVPGVEVGDEFQYRVELAIVGVHRLYQAGIDYMKQNGMLVAISIVSSGAYADDKENADSLIYCGQGGNIVGKDKEPEDQKLERGNLALRNSISVKNHVRVIHGFKESKASNLTDSRSKIVKTYVYDGLYIVEKYWQEEGKHGKQVFMFKLKKIPGQPELSWKESNKSKVAS